MKTLAEFKREIVVGMKIQCNGIEEAKIVSIDPNDGTKWNYGPLMVVPLGDSMSVERTVTYKDTTGFYLSATPQDGKRGSYCQYPKASELFYDGTVFNITETTKDGQPWQRRHYTINA